MRWLNGTTDSMDMNQQTQGDSEGQGSLACCSPWGCSKSSSSCCFLTCIQVSQETGKVVWYSRLFKNFPWFVVIHTVKGFSIVNEAEINILLKFFCFVYDPRDVGNFISDSSAFSKPSLYIWNFSVHILLKSSLKDFEHNLTSM